HRCHQGAPLAGPRAMREVVELAKHVAWRAADDAGQRTEPLEVRTMARGALERLSRPAFIHQRLAFRQAVDRNIRGERRPRIAALELDYIVGYCGAALPG